MFRLPFFESRKLPEDGVMDGGEPPTRPDGVTEVRSKVPEMVAVTLEPDSMKSIKMEAADREGSIITRAAANTTRVE